MKRILKCSLAALLALCVCSCADPGSHDAPSGDAPITVESENQAIDAGSAPGGENGAEISGATGESGAKSTAAPGTDAAAATDSHASMDAESENELTVDGDEMLSTDVADDGGEQTRRSELSGTTAGTTAGTTSRSGGGRAAGTTRPATTRNADSTTRAGTTTRVPGTTTRVPGTTTRTPETSARTDPATTFAPDPGTSTSADPAPEPDPKPAVPAGPAPSYPLKGSSRTPAEANNHDVPGSAIVEGAGPLGSAGVYVGLHDFFFYGECVDYLKGDNPIPDGNIARFARVMDERDEWARQNGIELIFVIAPNKATVYNDYVPSSVVQSSYTRTDQIVDYLAANSTVKVVDLRQTLRNARASYGDDLYYRYDTHWNQYGAFTAYTEIMKTVRKSRPAAVQYGFDAFNVNVYETYMKDMAWYLGWYDDYYDSGPVFSLKEGPAARLVSKQRDGSVTGQYQLAYHWPDGYRDDLTYLYYKSKNTEASSVYVYQDSFGIGLMPFLKESFAEASFEWTHRLSKQDILEMEVDTVIIEVAEKELDDFIKLRAFY